ncbi:MAG TPA: tetratricopeptide repeat protein [Chthoniobacterales bacterium]|nr:tetratricopeptide repeat protein [Chthoniobacterales bacterium]
MAKGDEAKAVAILDRLSQAYPNNPLVKFQLARAYVQNNNIAQATAALDQAIAAKPDYADAILALAEINLRAGKAQPAVGSIEGLLKNYPNLANASRAETLLISGYQALGRLDEAAAVCRENIKRAPQSAAGYFMLGLILHQQKKDDDARAALEKAAELAPDDFNALDKLVELDLLTKRYDAATARVQEVLRKNPNTAPAHFLEAKVYIGHGAQGDLPRAESALRKAIELDPNFAPAYDLLTSIYIAQDKSKDALNELKIELAKNPKNPRLLLMTALMYERLKDYGAAREFYEKLLAVNGDSVLSLNNLAYLYAEKMNDLNKAYELAQKARSLQPANGMVADTFGWILYKRGDYQQALASLQDSVAKFPDNPEVQYHLGMAQYMMGNTDQARAALQKAVRTESDFSGKEEAQKRLAQLENSSSKEGPAGQVASKSGESNDLVALLREADSSEKQGDSAKAASTYERAFRVNPKLANTALKVAQLNSGPLHQPGKALEFARKARDLAPNDPKIGAAVGRIALQCEKFDWAYSLLQESTLRTAGDPAVLHDFAMANYALGKVSDARRIMQQAMGANPGAAESEDGKRFLAMTAAEQPPQTEIEAALKAEPDYVPALMAEAAVNIQPNKSEKAASTYQSVLKKYPDFAPAQKQLAAIYASDSAKLKQAYDLAMKARKAMPDDPELSRTLAELSFKRNEFPYAAQLFQESATKQPLPAIDLYYLGMAQLQSRQEPKGRETLQKALTAGLQDPFAQEAKKRLAEQPTK